MRTTSATIRESHEHGNETAVSQTGRQKLDERGYPAWERGKARDLAGRGGGGVFNGEKPAAFVWFDFVWFGSVRFDLVWFG